MLNYITDNNKNKYNSDNRENYYNKFDSNFDNKNNQDFFNHFDSIKPILHSMNNQKSMFNNHFKHISNQHNNIFK